MKLTLLNWNNNNNGKGKNKRKGVRFWDDKGGWKRVYEWNEKGDKIKSFYLFGMGNMKKQEKKKGFLFVGGGEHKLINN